MTYRQPMLAAQIAMGVLAVACALLALIVMQKGAPEHQTAIISLLVLALFFVALMVWAGFLPDYEVIEP